MEKPHFWSSAPGIITGVAGLLSATAALVGLLVTFGVIGGKDSTTKTTGGASEQTTDQSGGAITTTAATPTFSVKPTTVSLEQKLLGATKEATVTVTNTGQGDLTVQTPRLGGDDQAQFAAQDLSCTDAPVPSQGSCKISVTFAPKGNGQYRAKLLIPVKGISTPTEVTLQGSAGL